MSTAANAALANPWKDLWNGDLGIADQIIAGDFVAHAAPLTGTGPDEIRGREALKGWISGIHAVLPDLTFVIEVGPITGDEHLIVRWKAQGTYRGGFPRRAGRGHWPARQLHRCRHPARRRRQARRVLGQHRQPAVLPAARHPRGARRVTARSDLRTADGHLNGHRRRIRMHATNSPSTEGV